MRTPSFLCWFGGVLISVQYLTAPKEAKNPLFRKEDVEGLFQGWGVAVF